MKEQLSQIIDTSIHKHALIEAGHFYGDKPLTSEQQLGVIVGQVLINVLTDMGLQVTPCLLIDDYHAPDIYGVQNIEALKKQGFVLSVIYRERSMIPGAVSILNQLDIAKKTKIKHGAKYFKDGFKMLVSDQGKYSCALLDAALYAEKHQSFDGVCVTVLPDTYTYRTQQQTTKSILKSCGVVVPILNAYFKQNGLVSLDFDY